MPTPNALSKRNAISAESADFSLSRLFNAYRVTPRTSAAAVTVKPSSSITSARKNLPTCGGFFIGRNGMARTPFTPTRTVSDFDDLTKILHDCRNT